MFCYNKKASFNMLIEKLLIDCKALSEKKCIHPILGELAYATKNNFTSRVVNGYSPDAIDVFLLEVSAAYALCDAQNSLNKNGLGLYFYDGYRPLRAVQDFGVWCEAPVLNQYELDCKNKYYPNINKADLIPKEYLGYPTSRHNYGFAADVGLIDLSSNKILDMGACFDFFDEISHLTATAETIGQEALDNRNILSEVMQANHFLVFEYEFWHFDFKHQPITTPIDIAITKNLKGLGVS